MDPGEKLKYPTVTWALGHLAELVANTPTMPGRLLKLADAYGYQVEFYKLNLHH